MAPNEGPAVASSLEVEPVGHEASAAAEAVLVLWTAKGESSLAGPDLILRQVLVHSYGCLASEPQTVYDPGWST